MSNEILWVILLIVSYFGIILAYRLFGKTGLYVWTAMAVIIANIQVLKTISFFGYVTAMGNIIYGSTFLVTDILCENHGKKDARRAVWLGFFILIAVTVIMQIVLMFTPHESDMLSPALEQIFGFLPGIAISSLLAYLISQNFDVWFFNRIKEWTKEKHLWIRNNLSTMVSQLIDNILFTFLAFIVFAPMNGFELPFDIIVQIFFTSYVMKWAVSVLDTPFLYWAKRMKKSE